MCRPLIAILAGALILGLLALPAVAQAPVTASVDRSSLSTDESLLLTVAVDSSQGQPAQPALPVMDGFKILGTSSGTQMSIINGVTTSQATFQVRLQPVRAGELTIPSLTVEAGGQSFTTDPIAITVTEGTGQPQPALPGTGAMPPILQGGVDPLDLLNQLDQLLQQAPYAGAEPLDPADAPAQLEGQEYYVEASVDNPTPYQGQQVVYSLRFYRAADPFGQIEYKSPAFTGFWSEQQPGQKDYSTQAAGRNYLVSEIETVLFPTVSGEVTIDPAELTVPSDLFTRGAVVRTQPLTLTVQALPADAPLSFQGAVGQFSIEAEVDKSSTQVGEPVTQRVVIRGEGNLQTMDDPLWPDVPGWRAFDSEATVETQYENSVLGGTRTYERVLVPTEDGQLTLPGIEFSYFDPAAGAYRTLNTDAVEISVAPDPEATATAVAAAAAATAAAPAAPMLPANPALRPVKAFSSGWSSAAVPLTQRTGYWLLWGVPVALLVGQFAWQQRQRHLRANAQSLRSQKAARHAHQALKLARQAPADADAAAGRILSEYIGTKLNRSVDGLTQEALANLLLARGVEAGLVTWVLACLTRSEVGRYAPAGYRAEDRDLLGEVGQVVDELEKQLGTV